MKLLDTNIVIYAMGKTHPYKGPCLQVMARASQGTQEYIIDAELLQEILHIFYVRRQVERGIARVNDLLSIFPNVIPIGVQEVRVASRILAHNLRLSSRDAIHAGVVLAHGLEGLVSTDRSFDGITGLVRYDPTAMVNEQGR